MLQALPKTEKFGLLVKMMTKKEKSSSLS